MSTPTYYSKRRGVSGPLVDAPEVAEALAAIQRVRELHEDYKGVCQECSDLEGGVTVFSPCSTLLALDGSHE